MKKSSFYSQLVHPLSQNDICNEYILINKSLLDTSEKQEKIPCHLSNMSLAFEPPKNAIYIILGEIQAIVSSKKTNTRWSNTPTYEESPEVNPFQKLKIALNSICDLHDIDSWTFVSPFLDIIRSDETSGPLTCLALNAVNKFLSYGLIDALSESAATTVHQIATAVTHTRFVGTNPNDDEVVLMRILQVLRSLLLSSVGSQLTNDSVCEILQSCFQICFETRLSELLRKTSEHVLVDMIQLLFARLPQFKDDLTPSTTNNHHHSIIESNIQQTEQLNLTENNPSLIIPTTTVQENEQTTETNKEFVNPRGIRFSTTPPPASQTEETSKESLSPYGWPCVRGLFRYLTQLINNYERNNTEYMITVGLNLLTVALEVGADYLANYPPLLSLVQDSLCRNLLSMFNSNRLHLFSAALRVAFLIFESLRTHLKYQFEFFITRLMELIISDQTKLTYEHKEIALETIIQLLRIPGLPAELYLNYDCDLYCSNLFEELTKMLSKNAFPVAGLTNIHILSLDALLSVIDHIELECQFQVQRQKNESNNQSLTRPIPCGYALALSLQNLDLNHSAKIRESRCSSARIRQNRMMISSHLPSQDDLKKQKNDKKLLRQGTEFFNQSPSSGIEFLQQKNFLSTPLNINEIVQYIRDNPLLDKKTIGEYLSNRKNLHILEQYVKTFNFEKMRVDEALRIYLSEFRLPGEAPLISSLLEHFAAHWRECNDFQLANNDAAFGLAYACIMLNTDQHNTNVRRQSLPMTLEDFKRNLSGMNNNDNFDEKMLADIYNTIKANEIIMPTEQTGLVRESYLWKLMLNRAENLTKDKQFLHVPTGSYNHEIFGLIWGQTMAALSFVFEKSHYDLVIDKSIQGFNKCARIAAYYSMSDVFDNLVISLCKFTTLLNNRDWIDHSPVQFGLNRKARLAAQVVFTIAHIHGDILRDGWKNLLECIIQLYKAKLLPTALIEVEDFLDPSGRISLIQEQTNPTPKTDIGLFSSLAYFLGGSSNDSNVSSSKQLTNEEQEAIKIATTCIDECHFEQLIQETKFLIFDSLNELLKALIYTCQIAPESSKLDQDAAVFSFELLVKVVLQNRDRVMTFWPTIRHYFYSILVNANEKTFFIERTCIGLLRIAGRFLRREELASEVLSSLKILLHMKSNVLHLLSPEIAYGLHELLRTNAANIHQSEHWFILFSLIEVIGGGASPSTNAASKHHAHQSQSTSNIESDTECSDCAPASSSDKGYTSDSEIYRRSEYIVVTHHDFDTIRNQTETKIDRRALNKSCEILTFLIDDLAYVSQENFEYCVHCIRLFIEVTIRGQNEKNQTKSPSKQMRRVTSLNSLTNESLYESNSMKSARSEFDDDNQVETTIQHQYQTLAMQLLDLLQILHMNASKIYQQTTTDQTKSSVLWSKCWCPILQGIARLCCDSRRAVRSSAVSCLQRCILSFELHILEPIEWESVFSKVLFPLLIKLLETTSQIDPMFGIEETRVRVSQLLCRIFLQHLTPLLSLSTFTTLWLTILDFMDKYSKTDQTDMLRDSVRESLKNMLLVMNTTSLFDPEQALTKLTRDKIETFLPGLWDDVFKITTPPPMTEPVMVLPPTNAINIPAPSDATTTATVANESNAPANVSTCSPS